VLNFRPKVHFVETALYWCASRVDGIEDRAQEGFPPMQRKVESSQAAEWPRVIAHALGIPVTTARAIGWAHGQ
jgi:hypothetical protein